MSYYIGVDVGTTSVKLILVDEAGAVHNEHGEGYAISQPKPGWKEIDPDIWYDAVMYGLNILLDGFDRAHVKGIGLTGQMHTVVVVDDEGRSIRPAVSWNDIRTKELIPLIKQELEAYPHLDNIRNIISAGSPAANLLWLKKNEPEHFAKIKKFLIGPNYIVHRFTGAFSTDYCMASTSSLYDIINQEWSPDMSRIIGLPESVYPTVLGSGQVAGLLAPQIADKLRLPYDVKVMQGTGDNPAAYCSSGQLNKGGALLSLGTSGVLIFPRKNLKRDAKGKGILYSLDGINISILVQGVVQSTGSSISWWINDILQSHDIGSEIDELDPTPPQNDSVLFFPHLVGDKTIYADPDLRGAFLNLSTDTSKQEMTKSIIEGIAFGVKQLANEMECDLKQQDSIIVTGGVAKNDVCMQILADVLGITVTRISNVSSAYGAAILAMGQLKDNGQTQASHSFYSNTISNNVYAERFKKYMRIYDAINYMDGSI